METNCSGDPQTLDGPLNFLGHTAPEGTVRPGDTIEIQTCWQVTASPQALLSLMLHLVGPGGAPVTIGDGLGVPIESWRAGDVLVQRHRLALPADAPLGEYTLATGAYWLDSLERWPVLIDGKPASDQVILPPISVTPTTD